MVVKYNRTKEWLKDFVWYEDNNVICFDNYIHLKHSLDYIF